MDRPTILVGYLVSGDDDSIVGNLLRRTLSDGIWFSFPVTQDRMLSRDQRASKLLAVKIPMVR